MTCASSLKEFSHIAHTSYLTLSNLTRQVNFTSWSQEVYHAGFKTSHPGAQKQPCIVFSVLSYLEKRHKEVDGVSLQIQARSPFCPTS